MIPERAKDRRRFPRVKSAVALELRYRGAVAPLRAMDPVSVLKLSLMA